MATTGILWDTSYICVAAHAMNLVQDRFCRDDLIDDIIPARLDKALNIAELLRKQAKLAAAEQMYFAGAGWIREGAGSWAQIDTGHSQQSRASVWWSRQAGRGGADVPESDNKVPTSLGSEHPSIVTVMNNMQQLAFREDEHVA